MFDPPFLIAKTGPWVCDREGCDVVCDPATCHGARRLDGTDVRWCSAEHCEQCAALIGDDAS